MPKKIYYHDTDAVGVVYYANYLKYFEEARSEYLNANGLDLRQLAQEDTFFVVAKVNISYKSPAGYGDELTVTTAITRKKNVSLDFVQKVKKEDRVLVSATTKLVCVGRDFKPKVMPEEIREGLEK